MAKTKAERQAARKARKTKTAAAAPNGANELDPKALAALVNREFGDNALRLGNDPYFSITRIPTGILSLDLLLGGGFPRGRHVEIYGQFGVGKTGISYYTIASAQRLGLRCAFLDCEHTLDPEFAEHLGVDISKLDVHEQESGNRVFDMMETLLRNRRHAVVVLDSIASLLPKQEREADMEAGSYGLHQAKLMSAALRRLTAANRQTVLIYINQLRDAIGVMFGKKSVTSGGRAMSFYASQRLELTRTETLKRKESVIDPKTGDRIEQKVTYGHRVLVRLDKEKSRKGTGSTTTFVFDDDRSCIDPVEDLVYCGLVLGIITKSGNSWTIDGQDSCIGRERFVKLLRNDTDLQAHLEVAIREQAAAERHHDPA